MKAGQKQRPSLKKWRNSHLNVFQKFYDWLISIPDLYVLRQQVKQDALPPPWYISWTANREALLSTAPYMRRLQFQNPILKNSMPGTVAAVKEKLDWSLADNSL